MVRTTRGISFSLLFVSLLLASCSDGDGDVLDRDGSQPPLPAAGSDGDAGDAANAARSELDGAMSEALDGGSATPSDAHAAEGPGETSSEEPSLDAALPGATSSDAASSPTADVDATADPAPSGSDAGRDNRSDETDAGPQDGSGGDAAADELDGASEAAVARPEETRFCGRVRCDCVLDGVPLFGKVRVVTAFGDFKVREDSFPDLRVHETLFPRSCGEWEFVDVGEDFSIEWVAAFEDFSIEYSVFPGLVKTAP